MKRILFASHGSLCEGMKDSIAMIAGPLAERIETYALQPGQNPQDMYMTLYEQIQSSQDKYVILCDVLGGSVHNALSQLAALDNAVVLSGMNLAMGLDLVLCADQPDTGLDYYQNLTERAKEGITLLHEVPVCIADEDFD